MMKIACVGKRDKLLAFLKEYLRHILLQRGKGQDGRPHSYDQTPFAWQEKRIIRPQPLLPPWKEMTQAIQ